MKVNGFEIKAFANLRGADLGGADLRGANLRGADLGGADLRGADLRGAYLRGADLGDADLRGAYLGDADLRGASLGGADLGGAYLIDAGQDARGYRFIAQKHDDGMRILAGCHYFESVKAARTHWEARHKDNPALHAECLAKIDLIEAVAIARGWLESSEAKAA